MRIKICGITNLKDAQQAIALGADTLGFIFYSKSPRAVQPQEVLAIARALPKEITKVGVFVNDKPKTVNHYAQNLCLDMIQLHGKEHPQDYKHCGYPIISVATPDLDCTCIYSDYVLIDNARGFKKATTAKSSLTHLNQASRINHPKIILGGGLLPSNVSGLIKNYNPHGVDVCSGVEQSPGVKCADKMKCFIDQAKSAFDIQQSRNGGA